MSSFSYLSPLLTLPLALAVLLVLPSPPPQVRWASQLLLLLLGLQEASAWGSR